jgi:hypothetical protein
MPRLVINPDTAEAWEVELGPGATTLGRSAENDVALEHPSISSAHCRITLTDGGAVLKDLGSTCGTFVGGQLVEEARLGAGQTFRLGEIEVRFESDDPVPAVAEPPRLALVGPGGAPIPRPPPVPSGSPGPLAPAAPPVGASAPVAAAGCKLHPRITARYACPQCRYNFCELCVSTRPSGAVTRKYCRTCGTECVAVQVAPAPGPAREPTFVSKLAGAFGYPFKGDGLALLGAGAVLYWLISAMRYVAAYATIIGAAAVGILALFGTAYLIAYLRSILTSSAGGQDKMPDWPDASDLPGEILAPCFQLAGTVAVCFLPAIAVAYSVPPSSPWAETARVASLVFGCAYFPMAYLGVSIFDSVAALNPLLVMPSIFKIPWAYLLTTVLMGGVLLVHRAADSLPEQVPIPVLPGLVGRFFGLYLLTVMMRMLGLLYRANRQRLGWFER